MLERKGRSHLFVKKGSNFSIKSLRAQKRQASLNHTASTHVYEHGEQKMFLDLFKEQLKGDNICVENKEKQEIGAKVCTLLKKLNMENEWNMFLGNSCQKAQKHIFHNKMLAQVIQTKQIISRNQRSKAEVGLIGKRRETFHENQKGRKTKQEKPNRSQYFKQDGVQLERSLATLPIFKVVRCQTHNIKTRPHRQFQHPR